jgi:hypothetical protein
MASIPPRLSLVGTPEASAQLEVSKAAPQTVLNDQQSSPAENTKHRISETLFGRFGLRIMRRNIHGFARFA